LSAAAQADLRSCDARRIRIRLRVSVEPRLARDAAKHVLPTRKTGASKTLWRINALPHNRFGSARGNVRNIHAHFQPKLPQNPHEYCALRLKSVPNVTERIDAQI
jgi:hypothetical protein